MWSYERDGHWWGWSFVRGSTVLSNAWQRMLGDEGEQKEEDCYHGDEDALRDPRSGETNKFNTYYTFHRSTRLCAVAVFVGLDMSTEDMQTTSPAEWWTWPGPGNTRYQTTRSEDAPSRAALFFFGARIWLGTILGRFSINSFSGLGLRIRVRVRVRVWLRVRVGVRVRVVIWSG